MVKIEITLNEMKEMLDLGEKEDFEKSWSHILQKGFIFNEFILIFKALTQSYKVQITGKDKEQKIKIRKIQYDDNGLTTKIIRSEKALYFIPSTLYCW